MPLLQGSAHVHETAQGRRDLHQGRQKGEKLVHLHVVGEYLPNRHIEHARERDRGNALHHRVADRFGARELHVRGAIEFIDLLEPGGLVILGVEDLDQAMRIDRFLGDPRDVAHRVLNALAVAAEAAVGDFHEPADHGCRRDAEQRQPPVHVEHVGQQTDDGQAVADQRNRRAGRRGRHQLDVVGELREQVPGLLPIQIRGGQAQIVREHVASQALDHLAAHPTRIEVGDEVAEAAQREQHDDRDRHLPQNLRIPFDEGPAHELLDHVRQPDIGRGEQDHSEYADQEYPDIGPRVAQQPPINRPGIVIEFRDARARGGNRAQGAGSR